MYKFISSHQSWLVKLLYSTFSKILTEFRTVYVFKENIVIMQYLIAIFLNVVGKQQHVNFISNIHVFCLILHLISINLCFFVLLD